MVLSEKFHLSLWGEGRTGMCSTRRGCPCCHYMQIRDSAFGEGKTKHFPQVWITLEVYITVLQKRVR